jgi:DNA-binding NtrC family response regulator
MLTAIHIGADSVLLQSRTPILEQAGLRVANADSLAQGLARVGAASFDLAVLCHSLGRTDRLNLAAAIRRSNPSALVVLVSGGSGVHTVEKEGMDAVLEPEPHRLLAGLRRLLLAQRKRPAAGRSPNALRPGAGRRL